MGTLGHAGVAVLCLTACLRAWAAQVCGVASVSTSQELDNRGASFAVLSSSGRFVLFASGATNLAPNDPSGDTDLYLHDGLMGQTTLISVSSTGVKANNIPVIYDISVDGRFVAFASDATNLVPDDTNGARDVFLRDRQAGTTIMISRTPTGAPGDWHSDAPSISANGRYVAFHSSASNLLPDPVGGGWAQVYVYDRVTGGMRLISRNRIDGGPGGGHSGFPSISADGNFIAYESLAGDLVPSDDNGTTDVFVCRRTASRSTCVSVSTALDEGNSWSDKPSTSADGRYVAFSSAASNLVSGDSNGVTDILVRDVTGGLTTRESLSSTGGQANGPSTRPSISDNGRYVAFDSGASNLAAGDTGSFTDVFIRDRQTQATTRMSVNAAGQGGNDDSFAPSITADGQAVAFHSGAWNFPPPGGTDLRPFQAFMASLAGNTPPQLLWAGGTGYTADGVDPGQGQANATSFRFRVRYRDANGDDPTYVRVIIERDGAAWRTLNMQAGAGAPFWGRLYSLTTRLPTGSYTYRFRAHDDDGGATGQGRVQQNGPTVTDGAVAVAITSLTALPSPAGAHVLFTLARPARITARILNVAGRPVCLLAREAEFPAGIGTLLWSGRSDAGLLAPGGVYVVEVAAQDEGGAESRAVTRLTLSR